MDTADRLVKVELSEPAGGRSAREILAASKLGAPVAVSGALIGSINQLAPADPVVHA